MNVPVNIDIENFIVQIIPTIFKDALSIDLAYSDTIADIGSEEGFMEAIAEFKGDVSGPMRLLVTNGFARAMTAARFDSQRQDIDAEQEMQNVISEMTNVAADHLSNMIAEAGLFCEHSTPSFSDNAEPPMSNNASSDLLRFAFTSGKDLAIIELGFAWPEEQPRTEDAAEDKPDQINLTPRNEDDMEAPEDFDLDLVLDIPIELTVELGRTRIPIRELLKLGPGSAVSLSSLEDEPVDILANDTLIARGQVVLQDKKYGIRVTEITSRINRIKSLN
jgi:flagellar motor switch protein FliN